ncbi:MAG TPA: SPOR domain-containing protein [Candidatus Acidoferrum sp.]|nr:SPOR domain-containing protein [Candidatus Acidoferrum sp.]
MGDNDLDVDEQEESSRSIFSALWFRVLLAVLVLGVLAAVAVPYVLDTSALKTSTAKSATVPPTAPATAAPAVPAAAPPAPSAAAAAPAESPAATAAPAAPTAVPATPPSSAATARAKSETPTAAPAAKTPTAKSAATKSVPAKSATMVAKANDAPKASESSKAGDSQKVSAKADQPAPKAADAATKPAEPTPKAAESTKASAPKAAGGGSGRAYWVQVGAFKDAETAKRVGTRLREQGFRVEESSTGSVGAGAAAPRASADRYDVVVSGASAADVEPRLAPKGLKGEATANGVVVRPSLALREAVALSRDLADAGLSVQVRRIGGPAPAPASAPAAASTPAVGQALYRVRVGGFADRTAAVDAVKQLEDKGFKPFIARGNE